MATTEPDADTQALPSVPWTDDNLDAIGGDDYFEEELPRRPLPKRLGPITISLIVLAMAAGAFYGGVQVEKHNVTASSSGTGAAAAAAFARLRAGAGAATTGRGGAAATTGGGGFSGASGTITVVDGNNIYVTAADGSIVKVITSPASQYSVTSSGTIASLHPGDNVTVVGPSDGNGNVTATSVTDTGAGGGTGGGRRGSGGGAGAGTGAATGGATARGTAGATPAGG